MVEKLPSGVLIVRDDPPPLPEPPPSAPRAKCRTCGRDGPPEDQIVLGWVWLGPLNERWFRRWWTCGHPKAWTCWECIDKPSGGCPVCGCDCEYC